MKDGKTSVAEIVLDEVNRMGAEYVFMVPGAHIAPLYAELCKKNSPKFIIADHEQEAAFMAIGYARASNKPGIVLAIGAPGAAYMVGAAVTAKADDVPVVFITGDIPQSRNGLGEFQDASHLGTNDSAIYLAAVGTSVICRKPEDIFPVIATMRQYISECKPLHVQIPVDIQLAVLNSNFNHEKEIPQPDAPLPPINLDSDEKVVCIIGSDALDSIDIATLKAFAEVNGIGVITDLKARGILPESALESIGYIGFSSSPCALESLNPASGMRADRIITVGVKEELLKQYVDGVFNVVDIPVMAFNDWLISSSKRLDSVLLEKRRAWLTGLKELVHMEEAHTAEGKVSYLEMFDVLNGIMPKETVYCLDAGQVRRAGNMFLTCHYPKSLIQSDTISPMGSAICAAVGAKLSVPDKPVVAIFGDGSMRMHGMALATAARYNIPVTFILCDNHSYANILKSSELREVSDLPALDWGKYAESLGVPSYFIDSQTEFEYRVKEVITHNKPTLLWVAAHRSVDFEYNQTKVYEYKDWLADIKEKFS